MILKKDKVLYKMAQKLYIKDFLYHLQSYHSDSVSHFLILQPAFLFKSICISSLTLFSNYVCKASHHLLDLKFKIKLTSQFSRIEKIKVLKTYMYSHKIQNVAMFSGLRIKYYCYCCFAGFGFGFCVFIFLVVGTESRACAYHLPLLHH